MNPTSKPDRDLRAPRRARVRHPPDPTHTHCTCILEYTSMPRADAPPLVSRRSPLACPPQARKTPRRYET